MRGRERKDMVELEEFIWHRDRAAFVRFTNSQYGGSYEIEMCNEWECSACHYEVFADAVTKKERRECPSCGRKTLVPKRVAMERIYPPLWISEEMFEDPVDVPYEEVRDFIHRYVYLSDERLYDVLASFAIASWKREIWRAVPYLAFIGNIETGKTRALEVLRQLCYHAVSAVSITPAAITRVLDEYKCTLLLDQAEKLLTQETEAGRLLYSILLSGYRRDLCYIVAKEGSPTGVQVRDVFGFKAIASERVFDKALFSRCIIIRMRRGVPQEERINEGWGFRLRSELLVWRAFRCIFPSEKEMREMGVTLKGREREIWFPLLAVYAFSGYSPSELLSVVEEVEEEHKERVISSEDAAIVQSLLSAMSEMDEIYVHELAEYIGMNPRSVGRRLASLGIKRERSREGMRIDLRRNEERIKELAEEFYLQ